MKDVTIYDLARELNISAATVSRALKNHHAINNLTKKRIREKAEEMGYRHNSFASSLRSKKTNTLGVIVPRINSYFVASVLAGMEDAASTKGYNLIITHSLESLTKEIANAQILFNKRVDGLLISLAFDTDNIRHLEPFFRKKIPVVFFDRIFPHDGSISIHINNYKAAYEVTTHLIEQGCRRIMHLGGNMLRNVYSERYKGYRQALKDHDIPFNEKLLFISELNEASGYTAADNILKFAPSRRPDGVFAANDTIAVHCMIRLKSAGVRIPDEIAFAGFNNDPISKVVEPNLTTVNYSGYETGKAAVRNLIQQLSNPSDIPATHTIVLGSDIQIRESSLKPKPSKKR